MKIVGSRVKELTDKLRAINGAAGDTSRYSLEGYARENGLLKPTDVDRGSYVMISCPFHSDSTPSCQMKRASWRFNCFSCGLSGDWVEFVRLWENYQNGSVMTRTQLLERVLKDDLALQAELGFGTLYTGTDKLTVDELPTVEFKKFVKAPAFPSSFSEVASIMQKKGCNSRQIHLAISLMQSGSTPAEVYRQVFSLPGGPEVAKVYSLEDLEDA